MSATAQQKDFNRNVISTNLYSPFLKISSYSLSYERVLDKGYSPNLSQFSYRVSGILVRDDEKSVLYTYKGNPVYDLEATKTDGFALLTELRYYFLWSAPVGYYISVFGSYSNLNEVFTDRRYQPNLITDASISVLTRGIGVGSQYRLHSSVLVDVLAGYRLDAINETIKNVNENTEIVKDL